QAGAGSRNVGGLGHHRDGTPGLNHPPPTAQSAPRGNSSNRPIRPQQRSVPMSQPATARQISNAPEHSTAYYFIEGLNELGIEHLFCNFGTDHAPTIEALADRHKRGEKVPNVMLC